MLQSRLKEVIGVLERCELLEEQRFHFRIKEGRVFTAAQISGDLKDALLGRKMGFRKNPLVCHYCGVCVFFGIFEKSNDSC